MKKCSTIYKDMSLDMCFNYDRPRYSKELGDYLACKCIGDYERVIKIFKNAQYTDEEINQIFDQFWASQAIIDRIHLIKPVKV